MSRIQINSFKYQPFIPKFSYPLHSFLKIVATYCVHCATCAPITQNFDILWHNVQQQKCWHVEMYSQRNTKYLPTQCTVKNEPPLKQLTELLVIQFNRRAHCNQLICFAIHINFYSKSIPEPNEVRMLSIKAQLIVMDKVVGSNGPDQFELCTNVGINVGITLIRESGN